jgi:hypothetical protein
MAVFWVVAIALMMGAARTSETLVNFYQTTRRYNPEDSHLHTHRSENLKSYRLESTLFSEPSPRLCCRTDSTAQALLNGFQIK